MKRRAGDRRTRALRAALVLLLALSAAPVRATSQGPAPIDQTVALQGITFHVTSPSVQSGNVVVIVPQGLTADDATITKPIDGVATGVEVADLNVDGSPEIFVYVRSADPSARGSLVAYAANRKKSLSAIHLPDLADTKGAAAGYAGHDEFAVLEGVLGRRFPLHGEDGKPTGKLRQLQYRLKPGETGWVLKVERVTEF